MADAGDPIKANLSDHIDAPAAVLHDMIYNISPVTAPQYGKRRSNRG